MRFVQTSQYPRVRDDRPADPVCRELGSSCPPDAGRPPGAAPCRAQADKGESLIFFASDGLVQNRVADYVAQGLLPTFRRPHEEGRHRERQRPADPGAAEHGRGLVQPGDRRVAGRARLDQQHLPHQRRAIRQPHGRVRPGRAAGRDARPGRRARRQEGRADRMGRRTWRERSTGPTVDYRTSSPAGALPPTTSAPTTIAAFVAVVRPAVRSPGRLCRPAALCRRRAGRRDRLDQRAGSPTARPRKCACACSTSARTSTG